MADDALVRPARIGVVLPPRETFGVRKSGAVALCVRDFARHSRFVDSIDILGAGVCEYPDVRYRRLTGWRRWALWIFSNPTYVTTPGDGYPVRGGKGDVSTGDARFRGTAVPSGSRSLGRRAQVRLPLLGLVVQDVVQFRARLHLRQHGRLRAVGADRGEHPDGRRAHGTEG